MELLQLFLIIVGGMVCGFIAIALTIYLVFKLWVRRLFKQFTDMAEDATMGIAPFMQPLRIKLQREVNPQWHDEAAMKRVVKPLRAAGFEEIGAFAMEDIPAICLQALVQPEKAVYAIVYEHPDRGVWFDFVSRYEDGGSLTSTSAPATGLDRPPNKVIERFETDTAPADAYQQHLTNRPNKALAPASRERFKADFERAYAEEMDWRFERGGFSEGEIRTNLKLVDKKTTDQQIKQVHAIQQAQVGQWLQTKLKENFLAKANLPKAKWRKIEDRVIFVHDRLTGEEVHGMFVACIDWEDDDAAHEISEEAEKLAEEHPAREAFTRMVELITGDRTFKKIGHVAEPVAADVYLSPEETYNEEE